MTTTWTQLRRQLARDVREPVFRRIGGEISVSGSTAISNFYATALGKITTTFGVPYGFAYCSYTTDGLAPLGQELEITNFLSDGTTGYAYVAPSPTAQLGAGDKVEIHELWSAAEKQDAINHAIDDAWPAFYQEVIDETIIIEKFKREYDLSTLAIKPRHLIGAYIEPIFRVGIGTVAYSYNSGNLSAISASLVGGNTVITLSAPMPAFDSSKHFIFYALDAGGLTTHTINVLSMTSTTITLSGDHTSDFSFASPPRVFSGPVLDSDQVGIDAPRTPANNLYVPGMTIDYQSGRTYEAALYYGTGAGHAYTIDTTIPCSDGVFLTSAPATINPGITEVMVKNISDVFYNWLGPLTRIRLDEDEYPTVIEVLYDTYEIWGARLRLVYAANLSHMTTEASTIDDNAAGYVIPRAKYHLYLGRVGAGPQFEVKTAATLADSYDRESDKYRDRNRMKRLGTTIKTDQGYINWSDREMPFRR